MDDLWEKMGEVRAGQVALNQRLDASSTERQQQHVEAIRSLSDTQAQQHEIKHELAQVSTKFAIIDGRVAALCKQVSANREAAETRERAAEARETVMLARIDGLFVWRAKLRGAWAAVGALGATGAAVYGHDIWDTVSNLLHWRQK